MERETAMKTLKELHDNSLFSNRIALETIIPQLADGNDERIRKDIIAYIRKANGEPNNILPYGSYCVLEMITWLEKQGKQKLFDYEHATITQKDFASVGETATIELSSPIDCGDRIYHVSHKPIEKQGKQKPTWSEEDDYNLQCMIAKVTSDIQKGNVGRNNELIDWLKSLKDRMKGKEE